MWFIENWLKKTMAYMLSLSIKVCKYDFIDA